MKPKTNRKRAIFILLSVFGFAICGGLIFAQGRWSDHHQIFQTYNPNTMAPPLALPDAYALAFAKANAGISNGGYYCVSASCLGLTNNGETGWDFHFLSTNSQPLTVVVYFDSEVIVRKRNEK